MQYIFAKKSTTLFIITQIQKKIKIKYEIFQKSNVFFFEICYNVGDVILRRYNSSFFNTFCRIMQKFNGRLF